MKRKHVLSLLLIATAFACSDEEGVELCGAECNETCAGALPEGLVGSYLGAAQAPDGKLWLSAYADRARDAGERLSYGDLVLGTYDPQTNVLGWQTVAGIGETSGCSARSPRGFRGGRLEAGDDVGLFTGVVASEGRPLVTYYDATHRSLRAARREGEGFVTHAIAEPDLRAFDVGRQASLVSWRGRAVAAFVALESVAGGKVVPRVRVAEALSGAPASASDWKIRDAAEGAAVTLESMNDPTVATRALGSGLGLAANGECLALGLYDVEAAKVVVLRARGDAWERAEAESAIGEAYGPSAGAMSRLAVDEACNAHIVYRVSNTSPLMYRTFPAQGAASAEEIVDDGATTIAGHASGDGPHLLADGSVMLRGSEVIVAYQDATAGRLRVAVRGASWARREAPSVRERLDGAFPAFVGGSIAAFGRLRVADAEQGSVSVYSLASLGL